jgi:putative transposase
MNHSSHAVFSLQAHLVFVTKYRKKVITPAMLQELESIFTKLLVAWECTLLEFGGEVDHVHLLISYHPNLNLSILVNNLKSVSSRLIRATYESHLRKFYWKPVFWHRAYYAGSVGHASLETVKRYVESQGI